MDLNRLACPCCGETRCTPALISSLDALEATDGPQRITSGYRCPNHQAVLRQAWVRGKLEWEKTHQGQKYPVPEPALNSQHSLGNAIDELCPNDEQPARIEAAKRAGFRGIGIGNGMLHLDVRPVAAEWRY
jgi:uncharacterized protein YcbK (DUF882 family)